MILIGEKLSIEQCPKKHEEIEYITHVTYASVVGSLMYAMVYIWIDIDDVVGVLSRYMSMLGKENQIDVKRVFRYFHSTTYYAIYYQGKFETDMRINVHGFVDFDQAGDINWRKSTNAYVLKLFNGEIVWMSRRQLIVALSTTEAKYMETNHVSK